MEGNCCRRFAARGLGAGRCRDGTQCDITGNGTVSQIDAMRVLEFVAGLRVLSPEQQFLADASGNGRVTTYDVTCMMKASAGIPVAGSHCDQMVPMP